MTSSNDDKSDICQFFYQDLFHVVNTVYVQNIFVKWTKMFWDAALFFTAGLLAPPPSPQSWYFQKSPAQVGLKNVKNAHGRVLQVEAKVTLFQGRFSCFYYCRNGTKLCTASHIILQTYWLNLSVKFAEISYWIYRVQIKLSAKFME